LKNELNLHIREDLKCLKDEMIQDFKNTHSDLLKSFVSDLKAANETFVNKSTMELKEFNQATMQSFKEEFLSLREMLLKETKGGTNTNASASFTSTATREHDTNVHSDDKIGDDDAERCDKEDNFKTTLVQTIEESRSPVGLERFQRTSNLVVLFARSTNLSRNQHNDNDDNFMHSLGSVCPEMPQEAISKEASAEEPQVYFHPPQFPQIPSLSSQLLDIEDQSDDDFEETVVVPKNP